MTPYIHALETGLSSDPPMNWRLSALDSYTLVSNSDAHSPQKLGREANRIEGELSYSGLKTAIETGQGCQGTIEFFPEEGKYHLDGHRNCHQCLTPSEDVYKRQLLMYHNHDFEFRRIPELGGKRIQEYLSLIHISSLPII